MIAVIAVYSLRALIHLYCHEVKHLKKKYYGGNKTALVALQVTVEAVVRQCR